MFPNDDDDVKVEQMRIAEMSLTACRRYSVFVDQLEQRISENSRRLNTISFALDKYISMGAYGSHNSGKSKFLRKLVGGGGVRFGEVYLNSYDIKHQPHLAFRSVGYSGQGKLCGIFTPRQLFTLIFMMKGIPKVAVVKKIRELSNSLELKPYLNTRIHLLPIDVVRRVSIGISLIAFNKVLVLDEPTANMPPLTRRIILNVLRYARFCGKTLIFTSFESIECETLADYIIVIDKGELLAIGSPQYLKQKYTRGFYLHVKLLCDDKISDDFYAM